MHRTATAEVTVHDLGGLGESNDASLPAKCLDSFLYSRVASIAAALLALPFFEP